MLFFLYLTASFASENQIPDAAITSSELISSSKKMILPVNCLHDIFGHKIY